MTDLLCHTDSYLKTFTAKVVAVNEETRSIILDRTAFYPGGGGQLCDTGILKAGSNVYPVVKVKKSPEGIAHEIGEGHVLSAVGTEVNGEIDLDRR